jgi:hypothetical protein
MNDPRRIESLRTETSGKPTHYSTCRDATLVTSLYTSPDMFVHFTLPPSAQPTTHLQRVRVDRRVRRLPPLSAAVLGSLPFAA